MTTYRLWDNFVGPPSVQSSGGVTYENLGSAFYVSVSAGVTHFRWYAGNGTSTTKPASMSLWDGDNGTELAYTTTITNAGATGWQQVALASPVALVPGKRYVVSASFAANILYGYSSTNAAATPPLGWASNPKTVGAQNALRLYPNATASVYWCIDVVVDDTEGGAGGTGGGVDYQQAVDAANSVANSWLSTTGNDYPTISTPYLTWGIAGQIKTTTDRLNNLSNGAITWLNDRSGQLTDFLNGVNSGAVTAINALASRITGSGAGGGSAFYGSGGTQVAQAAEDVLALAQLLVALERNALGDFPGTPWVQTDTTTFDTSLAWTVAADLYVVSFSDLGGGIVNLDAAGVDVSYRLAWWSPLIGSAGQQRRFIDFPASHLWLDGQRMPGLLLHSPKGATGSVQAWTYD